jgi:hypothetical protein
VALVDQWLGIESGLPDDWADARLMLTVADERRGDRAAALLGPANPGRRGKAIRFFAARRGQGLGAEAVRRLLRRLDTEGITGELQLLGAATAPGIEERTRPSLAEAWDAEVAALPSDWSDVYAEIELDSTDYLERGALLMAPLNPARYGGVTGFRFRVASHFGYGASPGMARRCLERLDREGITGRVRILRALSDSRPVATQGPVWYVGGKPV